MKEYQFIPENAVWELTLRCNMRCIHCGSAAGKARYNELTIDECLDIADQLIDLGCKKITIIGGEVFLYNGWEEIARKFSDGGVVVNIITNGYLMENTQIDQIKYAKLANVGLSLDGMAENHNRIRNVKNAFQKVLIAFEQLRNAKISIGVVTTLLELNISDLEPLYHLLVENGVEVWQLQIAAMMGSMSDQEDIRLDPAKVPLITKFIKEKRFEQKVRLYAGDCIGYYNEDELYLRNQPGTLAPWDGCQAGLQVIGIDSVGNVKGCESLYSDRFIEGNLRQETLRDIWLKEGNFAYNRQFDVNQLTGTCTGCDLGHICRGGCRSSCYFSTGSLYENAYCCYPNKPKSI